MGYNIKYLFFQNFNVNTLNDSKNGHVQVGVQTDSEYFCHS